tara:strand:- start:3312 stop:4223 length:912 start_codon:yes stop_codon:yes gene_type:complete
MSETLNVNVLVAAKEEYSKQLINCIQPSIYDVLLSIFEDSQKNNIRLSVSYSNFQKELKAVPHWADYRLEEKISPVSRKFPYLMDLITAIFVSHVKILACVRLKTDDKSVKIKVPSLKSFLHKIIVACSEQIYYDPQCIHDEKVKMFKLINESINETIANQIPIEYILSEYLSGAFDEPETKYPENNDVIENELDEDDEDLSDEEEFLPENKEIPIIPISNPVHSKVVEQLISNNKEDRPEDTQGETEPHGDSIEDINELKSIEPGTDVTVNKQFDISDDDESDDDESEDENEEYQVKENTLF